ASQWSGISNINTFSSDQLTIQYLPQYIKDDKGTLATTDDVWYGGFDCEGNNLEFTLAQGRQVIVQRYFLRADSNKSDNEPNQPLALACDA
ncbi:pilus assembly protein PilW, partial [Acinetobacter bohemicus]|nr:pilus assembly protein PilW [Acinetobacter bohemicus]